MSAKPDERGPRAAAPASAGGETVEVNPARRPSPGETVDVGRQDAIEPPEPVGSPSAPADPSSVALSARLEMKAAGGEAPSLPQATSKRYAIQGEVARGGMGAILRVWDSELRRHLAMKVMLGRSDPGASGLTPPVRPEELARFLEEAQVTGQLDHPGIVPVHELGIDSSGRVFFTMRLVKGQDLKAIFDLVREGKDGWTQTRALSVIVKVCEALGYAHAKGVIHRDIKPANIMVGRFGETYVMDWGLAKLLGKKDTRDLRLRPDLAKSLTAVRTERSDMAASGADSPLLTMDGTVVGTPAYMPPEQAEGKIEDLDARADVYSTGAMLYELLAGQMPYVEPGARVSPYTILGLVLQGPPQRLEELDPRVPPELAAICERAMARDKAERYPSTKEMAEDLQAYLENRVVRAHRTGAVAEFKKWVVRNKGVAASLAALFVFISAALVVSLLLLDRVREEESAKGKALADLEIESAAKSRALTELQIESAAKSKALAEKDAALVRSEGLRLVPKSTAALSSNPALALLLAIETAKRAPGLEANNALSSALAELHETRALIGHHDPITAACFSPDGRTVLTTSLDETARIWDARSGKMLHVLGGHTGTIHSATFSPDGSRIATAASPARIWDADSGKELHVVGGYDVDTHIAVFSPDGKLLVTASESFGGDRALRLWEVVTGKESHRFGGHRHSVDAARFSPDGRRLVTTSSTELNMRIWDVQTGETIQAFRWLAITNTPEASFSPDNRRVLIRGSPHALLWDVDARNIVRSFGGAGREVLSATFSPDGRLVLATLDDRTARIWEADSGKEICALEGHEARITSARFSSDGRRVLTASADRTARVWDSETGDEVRVFRGHESDVESASFSPDGQHVLTASKDGTARIWMLENELRSRVLSVPLDGVLSAAFALGGKEILIQSDSTAQIWDDASGARVRELRASDSDGRFLHFSPDAKHLAAVRRGEFMATFRRSEFITTLREIASGRQIILTGHRAPVSSARFSPVAGSIVTASMDRTARIWEVETGRAISELSGHRDVIHSADFSADGKLVVTTSDDGTVRVWDALSGRQIQVLAGAARSACLSPDGKRVVTASSEITARLWAVESGQAILELEGHERTIHSASFSPDGLRVVTASADHTARIWDVASGKETLTLRGHEGEVFSASFSPDGERVVTASADKTVRIWPISLLPAAIQRKPRDLTPDEFDGHELGTAEERAGYRWSREAEILSAGIAGELRCLESCSDARLPSSKLVLRLIELSRLGKEMKDRAILERARDFARDAAGHGGGEPRLLACLADLQEVLGEQGEALHSLERALLHPHATEAHAQALNRCRAELRPHLASFASVDAALDEAEVLVGEGAEWRYFRGKAEPSAEALGWTRPEFDDSSWERGTSSFGYGFDVPTKLADMRGSYTTLYVRRELSLDDPASVRSLVLSVIADDGFVAYWNGQELGRALAGDTGARLPFDAVATRYVPEPLAAVVLRIPDSALAAGKNVLAIQCLNCVPNSSDLFLLPTLACEWVPSPRRDGARSAALQAAASGGGDSARIAYYQGRMLQRSGKHRDAIAELEKVVTAAEDRSEPIARIAECHRALGEPEKAEARLRAAIEAGADDSGMLWNRWFEVSAADRKRSAAELLAALPAERAAARSSRRDDLRSLLEELVATGGVRIRCGAADSRDRAGNLWGRDRFFTAGYRPWESFDPPAVEPFRDRIQGTDDHALYRSKRYFPAGHIHPPGYRIPLPAGRYRLTLHFAEIDPRIQPGDRRFDIEIEGKTVLAGYEPLAAGFATADRKTFETAVSDGFLDLVFVRLAGDPEISAIEIERRDK